jgi:gliding motility-associated-like protein
MKKLILLITVITFYFPAFAQQNLILNGNFEDYNCIPGYQSFHCVNDWFNPSRSNNTPSYFHRLCTDTGDYGANVPNNWIGTQPSIDGDAYMALHMGGNQAREYAGAKLREPLKKGRIYNISFYTAQRPNPSPWGHNPPMALNGHGVLFEMNQRSYIPDSLIAEPHFFHTDIVYTNGFWKKIEASFIADSTYEYMLVGNFLSFADPRFQSSEPFHPNTSSQFSYYFDLFELTETNRQFTIDYQKNQDCFPVTITLFPSNLTFSDYWKWTFEDGTTSRQKNAQVTFDEPGTYTIKLAINQSDGKIYYFDKIITLEQAPLPIADFEANEELVMNSPINFENLSTDGVAFEWDFGDGFTSEDTNPSHIYTAPDDYTVTLTAYSIDGCSNTISYPIYITCGGLMNVNVFTPNSDGINDEFSFDSLQICRDFSITIFDRWGRLVFETQDPYQPWDGDEQPSGTYYYLIRYRNGGQEQGYVTLIR